MSYAVVPDATEQSHIEIRIRAEAGADGDALVLAARARSSKRTCTRASASRPPCTRRGSRWGRWRSEHEAPITAFQRNLLDLLA